MQGSVQFCSLWALQTTPRLHHSSGPARAAGVTLQLTAQATYTCMLPPPPPLASTACAVGAPRALELARHLSARAPAHLALATLSA